MSFLVDTGAELSVCKFSSISVNSPINHDEAVEIAGITPSSNNIHSLGTIVATVILPNASVTHKFHIIKDSDINLVQDALLGMAPQSERYVLR